MKKIKIATLVVGAIILAGCGNKAMENSNGAKTKTEEKSTVSQMITSVTDAMKSGKTMKCTYKTTAKESDFETITYVKGNKYMTENNVVGVNQKMIFDGETTHSWGEGQKQGMKMTKDCMEEMESSALENEEYQSKTSGLTEEQDFESAVDVKCEEVSDVDFSIPSDVEFVDQCEMLKDVMKNMSSSIPQMP